MKLRIQGNSLRLRISQSEVTRLMKTGSVEETIYFGTETGCQLTYVLANGGPGKSTWVESTPQRIAVMVADGQLRAWSSSGQVGIEAEIDLGIRGRLSVLIEKDFACLDGSAEENADTFPNPLSAHIC